jgi:hypothetical protein
VGSTSISIGASAGQYGQLSGAVAIGQKAGNTGQQGQTVAIGYFAGQNGQQNGAVAIGQNAGFGGQNNYAVAIGAGAGESNQGTNSVAIGTQSGQFNQGQNAVAIGIRAGQNDQPNNSIILNATGSEFSPIGATAFYVNPVRGPDDGTKALCYNTTTFEITYGAKTFVIDHPIEKDKYLVHACLEGPEAGVYYRGTGEITNNACITIDLPAYASILAKNFTISVTPIYSKSRLVQSNYQTSELENGSFTVYGKNGRFFWVVYGERCAIEVEPLKSETNVKGTGPYKWIS